jgi:hypothetical protein
MGLAVVGDARLVEVALGERLVGVDALGDHEPEAAAGEPLVVAGHRLRGGAVL